MLKACELPSFVRWCALYLRTDSWAPHCHSIRMTGSPSLAVQNGILRWFWFCSLVHYGSGCFWVSTTLNFADPPNRCNELAPLSRCTGMHTYK